MLLLLLLLIKTNSLKSVKEFSGLATDPLTPSIGMRIVVNTDEYML